MAPARAGASTPVGAQAPDHEILREAEQRREREKKSRREETKRELISRSEFYALRELKDEDLHPLDRLGISRKVARILEEEINGTESWVKVEGRVNEVLDEELGEE